MHDVVLLNNLYCYFICVIYCLWCQSDVTRSLLFGYQKVRSKEHLMMASLSF